MQIEKSAAHTKPSYLNVVHYEVHLLYSLSCRLFIDRLHSGV